MRMPMSVVAALASAGPTPDRRDMIGRGSCATSASPVMLMSPHRLNHEIVRRLIASRPGLPEAGDGTIDDLGLTAFKSSYAR